MLVLVETPAGYGLFKAGKKLTKADADDVFRFFESEESAQKAVKLHAFSQFKDTKTALAESQALIESKLGSGLKKFLKKNVVKLDVAETIAVWDKSLAATIKQKLGIDVVVTPQSFEIVRGVRQQLNALVEGLKESDAKNMSLSLSHSLNRFKLKFSPEKVDTMIVQAVGLLDDLDKELNNFAMRLKEWYGWHFPEMSRIVTDNVVYAKAVKHVGFRTQVKNTDFTGVLPEEVEIEVKAAAEVSMGTDITQEDLEKIFALCDSVVELSEYRASLADYLRHRMEALAPNLTYMVGELVGARLVAHAGSLMSLAKHPASTVQILGAEKALFRALKAGKQTPKYGLLYHAAIVGQASPQLKGKMSRVLAAKLALNARVDALGETSEPTVAIATKRYVENRLAFFQEGAASGTHSRPNMPRYEPKRNFNTFSGTAEYSDRTDVVNVKRQKFDK